MKSKPMSDAEVLEAYGAIRLCHPKIPRVRGDHDLAREHRKKLTAMLRELEFSKRIPGYGQCCPICNEEAHADDCALALLLAEVAP